MERDPELLGTNKLWVWEEMRNYDVIATALNAIDLTVMQATFKINAAGALPEDERIATELDDMFRHMCPFTWNDAIENILLMTRFGFSLSEPVWKEGNAGLLYVETIEPRHPLTVYSWNYDENGRLDQIIQRDAAWRLYPMDQDRYILFTHKGEGGNWMGEPVFKFCKDSWEQAKDIRSLQMIGLDNFSNGIPVGTAPAGVRTNSPEWNAYAETLGKVHAQQEGYILKPDGWELDKFGNDNFGPEALKFLQYLDQNMLKLMMVSFLNLGTSATGSRALGSAFLDHFHTSVQSIADQIAQTLTARIIRPYMARNYPGRGMPEMVAEKIKMSIDELSGLAKAKLITPDVALEETIRARLNLPGKTLDGATKNQPREPRRDPENDSGAEEENEKSEDLERNGASLVAYEGEVGGILTKLTRDIENKIKNGKPVNDIHPAGKKEWAEAARQFAPNASPDKINWISLDIQRITSYFVNTMYEARLSRQELDIDALVAEQRKDHIAMFKNRVL
jgi:hypothetical protein